MACLAAGSVRGNRSGRSDGGNERESINLLYLLLCNGMVVHMKTIKPVVISFYCLLAAAILTATPLSVFGEDTAFGEESFFPFLQSNHRAVEKKPEWYALDERLTTIENAAADPGADEEHLRRWVKEVGALKDSIDTYVALLESQQKKMDSDLATLGEAVENEPEAVADQRKQIERDRGNIEGKLSGYRLLVLHSEKLQRQLTEQRQQLLTQHFLARGPSVLALLEEEKALSLHWIADIGQFALDKSGVQRMHSGQLMTLLGLGVVSLLLGMVLRRRIRRWCEGLPSTEGQHSVRLYRALGSYAPHLLVAATFALFSLTLFPRPPYPFIHLIALTLPILFLTWVLVRALVSSRGSILPLENVNAGLRQGMERSLKFFALLAYFGYLLFATEIVKLMPESGRFLTRDFFTLAMVITLMWGARYLHLALQQRDLRGFYSIVMLLLLATLGAELLGYRNLSYWVLRAMLGTLFAFGAFLLFARLVKEFFYGLKSGRYWWQSGLRYLLGYRADETLPWLGGMQLISLAALWVGFAYVVMFIWGVSTDAMKLLYDTFFDGFLIGSLKIVPARIVIAIAAFSLLMAISGWLRRRMEGEWLVKSRMERGTREAMVTIVGYLGVAVAILIALSVAGVQFTNLAIIAGALSVGIGFGLQNIVNNFVSGLILLFERPVKTGDWILVGNTEGYVKRIRIRSTLIQTFDRADVIVPNSELISGQVTNWMLYDPRGRVKVPIGVAYGSDTKLVHELLLKIAADHPNVITDGSTAPPKVLFIGFGDSSLNFELRAFVQNIDERLQIVSDINFAIDAAFREHGIEIPFPQRDLHVRGWQNPPQEPQGGL